jgi:hypothetical protein
MSEDWKSALNAMIMALEAGMWDELQLRRLIDELDERPDTILPHSIGLSNYVVFLCTKVHRPELARRILYATLNWDMTHGAKAEDIELSIRNITHVEKLLGRQRPRAHPTGGAGPQLSQRLAALGSPA